MFVSVEFEREHENEIYFKFRSPTYLKMRIQLEILFKKNISYFATQDHLFLKWRLIRKQYK